MPRRLGRYRPAIAWATTCVEVGLQAQVRPVQGARSVQGAHGERASQGRDQARFQYPAHLVLGQPAGLDIRVLTRAASRRVRACWRSGAPETRTPGGTRSW